jgi:hypothetical protein
MLMLSIVDTWLAVRPAVLSSGHLAVINSMVFLRFCLNVRSKGVACLRTLRAHFGTLVLRLMLTACKHSSHGGIEIGLLVLKSSS